MPFYFMTGSEWLTLNILILISALIIVFLSIKDEKNTERALIMVLKEGNVWIVYATLVANAILMIICVAFQMDIAIMFVIIWTIGIYYLVFGNIATFAILIGVMMRNNILKN